MRSIGQVQQQLMQGQTSSAALVDQALARAQDANGEGSRVYLRVYREQAAQVARAQDALRRAGVHTSPLAGIPISIKDLFDVAGEPTIAASKVLADAPPAARDAEVVRRLRAAGAVIIGRTNMPEFAYSGLGINPHYGTPRNPFDRDPGNPGKGRVPGGSSAGAAISVTDQMALVGIGSDTGGSVRIPAALCGLAGFKPTQRRVPLTDVYPLSKSLDSIGPLATCVADCALVDAVLAGEPPSTLTPTPVSSLRLLVPKTLLLDDLDTQVAAAFSRALAKLSAAGASIREAPLEAFSRWPGALGRGGMIAAEAYALHRPMLEQRRALYDPRVLFRIEQGGQQSAADYLDLLELRAALQQATAQALHSYDAMLAPTATIVAPRIEEVMVNDETFFRANRAVLRNTGLINFLDGCALTVPCQRQGDLPVGLMITGMANADAHILSVGAAIESVLGS